jgi:dipicolinate synthase subunit A
MKKRNIVIVGGDKRQKYLKEYLSGQGLTVSSYGLFDWDDDTDKLKSMIDENSVIILPLPATRNGKTVNMPFSKKEIEVDRLLSFLGKENFVFGGIIKGELLSRLRETDVPYIDYYDKAFIEKNAVLTAFGTLKIILEHIDFALPMGKFAVTGYGRVAKETASLLSSLSCHVTVFARNPSQREDAMIKGCKAHPITMLSSLAREYDIIINTVPSQIFTEETSKNINEKCKVIELASAPYGMDFELLRKNGVEVIKAFGLPGKYTPKTAGEIIGKRIQQHLQKEE